MPRVLLAVAILTIVVYGLVDVIRTDGRLTRGISKPAWIMVAFLPVIGAALWFILGRPRGNKAPEQSYRHPTAPDDDPDFLRNLEQRRRHQAHQAEADRLKKLKEELDSRDGKPGDKSDGSRDGDGLK
jgi:hypothetical protein